MLTAVAAASASSRGPESLEVPGNRSTVFFGTKRSVRGSCFAQLIVSSGNSTAEDCGHRTRNLHSTTFSNTYAYVCIVTSVNKVAVFGTSYCAVCMFGGHSLRRYCSPSAVHQQAAVLLTISYFIVSLGASLCPPAPLS